MALNTTNAICTSGQQEGSVFNTYISQCRTQTDTNRAQQFFTSSKEKLVNSFEELNAQFNELITAGNSMNDLMGSTIGTAQDLNKRINELTKKRDILQSEIKHYRGLSESSDKSFLEDIMHRKPKEELAPSLQDATLLLFSFGWLVLMFTLVYIRIFSPEGSLRAGGFTFVLLLLVTILVYGLIKNLA